MSYGLLPTGFVPKTLAVIREEINAALRAAIGPSLPLSDQDLFGQIVGIIAEREALLWELAEAVHGSQDPSAASGVALEAIAALTGTLRNAERGTRALLTLIGTPSTVVDAGSLVSSVGGAILATEETATIASAPAWEASTPYSIGALVESSGHLYFAISSGTSDSSGPYDTGDDVVDGTVHWRYIGHSPSGVVNVYATATATGPVPALAGEIATIETSVSGWTAVVNARDAITGNLEETDEDLRVRRLAELSAAGATTPDAVRADLLRVSGVTAVTTFFNPSDYTDGDGVPPHGVEVLVRGGDDQDILDAIWASVGGGIVTVGDESGTVVDSAGVDQVVRFSRPDAKEVYVDLSVIVDSDEFPIDGEDQIKAAIVAWGAVQQTGKDVVSSALAARAFGVAGVLDVTAVLVSVAPTTVPVASTTIPMSLRELAVYDVSRIDISVTEDAP